MLIESPRHTVADLERWEQLARYDSILAQSRRMDRLIEQAKTDLIQFARAGGVYAGVSWGKDSVVLAHLLAELKREEGLCLPVVWVKVVPVVNPDCFEVRDRFLADHDIDYHEAKLECVWSRGRREWIDHDRFTLIPDKLRDKLGEYCPRHISGVRGDESGGRAMRMRAHGVSTTNTCAPLGWWEGRDIYAYLARYDLPVHPAYACLMGGTLDRLRIRVDTLGGEQGSGHGREQWERRYYRHESLWLANKRPLGACPWLSQDSRAGAELYRSWTVDRG